MWEGVGKESVLVVYHRSQKSKRMCDVGPSRTTKWERPKCCHSYEAVQRRNISSMIVLLCALSLETSFLDDAMPSGLVDCFVVQDHAASGSNGRMDDAHSQNERFPSRARYREEWFVNAAALKRLDRSHRRRPHTLGWSNDRPSERAVGRLGTNKLSYIAV